MKKIVLILSILFLLPKINVAQIELDYEEDINPYFVGDSANLVFPLLYDFFKRNNDHPATNIQLAILLQERYEKAHPISDYESATANAQASKTLFTRAGQLIDDKEVRRNDWYYPNFTNEFRRNGKPIVEFDSVRVVFEKGRQEADSFLTYMPKIYNNFMKMVEQYDLATKNFVRINGDYQSLKDVYLLFDQDLEERFDLVKNSYDSTLYYFTEYRKAAANYPPYQINQKLSISTINTYRLDGLVIQTDFLAGEINLWDYASWVDQVKKVINTEIDVLRKDIENIENKLESSFSQMKNWVPSDTINLDPIDRKSIYKIRKYDLNSPVANVFQYRDDKLDLVSEQKSLSVYDTAQDISFQVKLYTINRVFQQTIALENDLKGYNRQIASSNLRKNKEFYEAHYGGIDGIKSYFQDEQKELLKIRGETAQKLKSQIIENIEKPFEQENPTYRKVNFQWQKVGASYDSLPKGISYINYSKTNVNELEYLAGYYLDADSIPKAYYGGKTEAGIKWYNTAPAYYEDKKVWQKINALNVVGGGDVNFLLFEKHVDSLDFINRIMVASEDGEIKNEIEVDTQEKPVELISLRNSNEQLALYQGDGFGDAVWPTALTIVKFHPDSSDYLIKEIDINGKFNGLFQTEAGIIVSSSSEDMKNIYLTLMDVDFNPLQKKTYGFEEAVDLKKYYQVSGESLHLVSELDQKGHIVLTDKLELRYTDMTLVEEGI